MRIEYNLLSIKDFMPANKRRVIIKCSEGIRIAYYESGVFWDGAGSDAQGYFDIEAWAYVD
jgi:hypothetical protein